MPQYSIHYHTSNRSQGRWQQRWLTWRNEIWISYLGFSFCSFVIQQIQPSSFRIIVFDHSIYLDLSGHVWFEISGYKPPRVCNLETSIFSVKAKVCNKITDQRWLSQPKLQLKANSICVLLNVLQQSKPDLDFPTEISEFPAQGFGNSESTFWPVCWFIHKTNCKCWQKLLCPKTSKFGFSCFFKSYFHRKQASKK